MSNWVPDEEGLGCSGCHLEFSLTRRRHHCRKCGALVCGACSDHSAVLPGAGAQPVRVCDSCEIQLKEAVYVSERLDVNGQINDSLKTALKEKAVEEDLFQSLLLHANGKGLEQSVTDLCESLQTVSIEFSELKMSSSELEKDIRAMAQRCLRAESLSRQALAVSREIEQYSHQIGIQDKLITQLHERAEKLSSPNGASTPISNRFRTPTPPRVEEIGVETRSVCQVAKAILFH